MIQNVENLSGLFGSRELEEIESGQPEGISSQEIISLFQSRGIRLSEPTFRKYVQLGLLPTSRRVGRKGKHRGSRGIYPVSVVRRINVIKRMMAEGMTLEDIRDSFLSIQNDRELVDQAMDDLLAAMQTRIERLEAEGRSIRTLTKDLEQARREARSLLKKIERLSSRLAIVGSPSIPDDQGGLS